MNFRAENWVVTRYVYIVSPSAISQAGIKALIESHSACFKIVGAGLSLRDADRLMISNADALILDLSYCSKTADVEAAIREASMAINQQFMVIANQTHVDFRQIRELDTVWAVLDTRVSGEELTGAFQALFPDTCLTPVQSEDVAHFERAPRVDVALPARIDNELGVTRNLSATGMYLEVRSTSHQVGDELLIEIDLESPDGDSYVVYRGRVVRRESAEGKVRLALQIIEQTFH